MCTGYRYFLELMNVRCGGAVGTRCDADVPFRRMSYLKKKGHFPGYQAEHEFRDGVDQMSTIRRDVQMTLTENSVREYRFLHTST